MSYESRLQGTNTPDEATLGEFPIAEPVLAPGRRRRRIVLGSLVAVAAVALVVWASHPSTPPPANADAGKQAPLVSVITPGRTSVAGTISATGVLAARHEMPVGAVGDGGEIQAVLVNAGDWVRAGQLLARIDPAVAAEQLANARANIAVAEADARLAQANLDRALKLVARGFISKANIDQLTATRDAAAARVKVAAAAAGEAAARLRRLDILAPADGLVLERDVEPGAVVGPGSGVLFRIAQHGEMELRARLSESDLAQLRVGQPAVVTPAGASASATGHIWQLAPMIDAATRQGAARIALAWTPAIRPGGFASATINSGTIVAPMIPASALQADDAGNYVYIVGPGDKAVKRPIKVGLVTDKGVAVTQGLTGNERVVLRAGAFLSPGEAIKPK